MTEPLLDIRDLRVSYGKAEALRGVSVTVPAGQIVTVIGANGAGKSTLLNATIGAVPSRGTIRFDGRGIDHYEIEARVSAGLALVPEQRELFTSMTGADNLDLGGYSARVGRAALAERLETIYTRFPRLRERRAQFAGTLSGGERQMLAMGRALMAGPKLLMLDEPSLGLAPLVVKDILRIVVEMKALGVSILLVEQNARAALAIADYAYVLENGAVTLEGPARDLEKDPRVIESYLGIGGRHEITLEETA